jgi:hypothetical protein
MAGDDKCQFCNQHWGESEGSLQYETHPVSHCDVFTTNENGNFVGHDKFIVPKNFDEFYERYPDYITHWVKRRLGGYNAREEDVEDTTQELIIHMKYLPETSKFRQRGCTDVVQTFNPQQQYGASEARFRNYINNCLTNKFNTLHKKANRNPITRTGTISLSATTLNSKGDESVMFEESALLQSSAYLTRLSNRMDRQRDCRMFTSQFLTFVSREDPSILPFVTTMATYTTNLNAIAEYLHLSQDEAQRNRKRVRQLSKCFTSGERVPPPRKPYKKQEVKLALAAV